MKPRRTIRATKRSMGTIQSNEGERQSSSSMPIDQLSKYPRIDLTADANLRHLDLCQCGDYRRDHSPGCRACPCALYRPGKRAVHVWEVS